MTETEGYPAEFAEDLAAEVAFVTGRLARGLLFRKAPGMSVSEMAVLSAIAEGSVSPTSIALRERMRQPSVTRHLTELDKRGLITRGAAEGDGRRSVLALTDDGKQELVAARVGFWLAAAVRELPTEDQRAIRAALPALDRLGSPAVPLQRDVPAADRGEVPVG
jgi:DNA-binding MarR family transcriptional regulator